MNAGDFDKNSSIPVKKHHNSPYKNDTNSCHENIGKFILKPQCTNQGRLLFLHVNLKNICPNKIIVVGVLIYENDKLYASKVKKMPTGYSSDCKYKDFDAGKFCFVFEEKEICKHRKFKAKVIYHYTECS
ncbi:hypothetical protein HBE96_15420 [Clostridium sp. P21]|uniref:Uncharacterized protein n=1 Tax=Clostridium muellerianum TaxID=2716538 RepID=A0A7Y0HQD9_9CLOT|nr:hypothetical protein [Clostridium muellerianum]NMM64036.1 hypothetical protein [Clostridium muellerianum]